ncbi:MAG: helix-turn-helix domain-containing protein [Stellaceae bacterium]
MAISRGRLRLLCSACPDHGACGLSFSEARARRRRLAKPRGQRGRVVPAGLLRQVGEALYGGRWQSPLAADLGVSDRTVRMWLSGRMRPRPGVLVALSRLIERRRAQLGEVAENLAAAIDPATWS